MLAASVKAELAEVTMELQQDINGLYDMLVQDAIAELPRDTIEKVSAPVKSSVNVNHVASSTDYLQYLARRHRIRPTY